MDSDKYFSVRHILKIILTVVFMLVLVACSQQVDPGDGSGEGLEVSTLPSNLGSTPLNDNTTDQTPLLKNIDSLVSENNLSLLISQQDSEPIPASASFAQRIIDVLSTHGEAVAKVVDVGYYDLVLTFEGYEDIYVNLDSNTFWFAGADHLYRVHFDLNELWQRYMIRVVDGELMYDAFEKTILRKIFFTDREGMGHAAVLFYDGDIRLSVDDAQVVIASNISEDMLSYHEALVPLTSYSLRTLGEQPLIAVVNDYATAKGPGANLHIFSYDQQRIEPVFATSEMVCELEAIDLEKGEVTIGLPWAETTWTHLLTSVEKERTNEILLELTKHDVEIDDEYIRTIKDHIVCDPVGIEFVDVGEDGKMGISVASQIQTLGASTPVYVNASIVFKFEADDHSIQLSEVSSN